MTSDAPPFHPAELALQERFGRRRMLEKPARRSIRDHLNQQHRDFFPQLPTSNPHREDGESYGADVSHRGGRPGFVRTDDAVTLTVPDYIGNSLFNTIGNLQVNPRAGLLFPNFVTGDILMLATRATVIWDDPEVREFAGAQRLLRFQIDSTIRLPQSLPLRSDGNVDYAPDLANTGKLTHKSDKRP
jgi:predicted pyridoxine 5'-phosphate oxidase superfamily flavin-nucleotide-binding protein